MERLELRVPPPAVTLVSALLMWGLRGAVPSLVWLVPGRAWLAGVLVGTGMMLGLWAVWSFRRQRTTINPHLPQQTVALVTEGVYRYTRNPMYLGMLCFLLAWALWLSRSGPRSACSKSASARASHPIAPRCGAGCKAQALQGVTEA